MPARSEAQRRLLNAKFGHDWSKLHHFDNEGKLPEHVDKGEIPDSVHYRGAEDNASSCGTCLYYRPDYCEMFSAPVRAEMTCDEWDGPVVKQDDAKQVAGLVQALEPMWSITKLVSKADAHPAELHLRVHGVTRHPSGDLAYRMETRDGRYVGRTNPTKVRAKKGDILTVQANHFMQDAAGDCHWVNPNVVSQYKDTAHSWRELEALAGGQLEKEGAPGPAGDIPPSNDVGHAGMPSASTLGALSAAYWQGGSGPTLGDVHANKPLPNISVSYAGRRKKLAVKKADRAKQLIYGVVLEPSVLDAQDDFMLPDQVEKAAHTYLSKVARGTASVSKLQHKAQGFFKGKPGVVPVESFIAPVDFSYDGKEMVRKGTWVMVLHAEDESVWNDVLSGQYTGFSIGGSGIRRDISIPSEKVPHEWMTTEPTWASGDS